MSIAELANTTKRKVMIKPSTTTGRSTKVAQLMR